MLVRPLGDAEDGASLEQDREGELHAQVGVDVRLQLHGDDRVEAQRQQRPIELDLFGSQSEESSRAVPQEFDDVGQRQFGRTRSLVLAVRRDVIAIGVTVRRGGRVHPVARAEMTVRVAIGLVSRDLAIRDGVSRRGLFDPVAFATPGIMGQADEAPRGRDAAPIDLEAGGIEESDRPSQRFRPAVPAPERCEDQGRCLVHRDRLPDRRGQPRLRADLEEHVVARGRQAGQSVAQPVGRRSSGPRDEIGRVLQAEPARGVRGRDLPQTLSDPARPARYPTTPRGRRGPPGSRTGARRAFGGIPARGRAVNTQLGTQRPAEVSIALLDRPAEGRLVAEELPRGAQREAGTVGQHEHRAAAQLRPPSARHHGYMKLAPQEGVEGANGLVAPGDDQRQAVLEMAPARAGRVGHVAQVQPVRRIGQEVAERAAEVCQGLRRPGRERDDHVLIVPAAGIASNRRMGPARGLLEDDVRIRAPEAERVHARAVPARPCGARVPGRGPCRAAGRRCRRGDWGGRSGGSPGWPRWCRASAALIRPATPAAASRWPMFVFTEPTMQGRPRRRPSASTAPERGELDRIAQRRARAVGLDVIDLARGDAGVPVGRAQDRLLGLPARGRQAVGPAVLVDRAAADHRVDRVAVGQGPGQRLEDHDARALAADVAVGLRVERLAAAVRRRGTRSSRRPANTWA